MTNEWDKLPKGAIALEKRAKEADARLFSPSAGRNREPILDILKEALPAEAKILEIASGTGEHGAYACRAMPGWRWRPSDLDPESRASQAAWAAAEGLENFLPPLTIDARKADWPLGDEPPYDALVCINMIHISPWEAGLGVFAGAGRYVKPGGALFFYGAFKRDGRHTAPSNEEFDRSLKSRNPDWGVRDLADVSAEVEKRGFSLERVVDMPANNLSVLFRRAR